MRLSLLRLKILTLAALLGSFAASPQSQAVVKTHNSVREALRARRGVVIVVKPGGKPEQDEAYGDWSDTLNRFATQDGKDFKFVVTTRSSFARMVEEPKVKDDYAILFLTDAEHGLFYDGMMFDYSDYLQAASYLRRVPRDEKTIKKSAAHEVKVRLR